MKVRSRKGKAILIVLIVLAAIVFDAIRLSLPHSTAVPETLLMPAAAPMD